MFNPIEKKAFSKAPEPQYKKSLNQKYYGQDNLDFSKAHDRAQAVLRRYNKINKNLF